MHTYRFALRKTRATFSGSWWIQCPPHWRLGQLDRRCTVLTEPGGAGFCSKNPETVPFQYLPLLYLMRCPSSPIPLCCRISGLAYQLATYTASVSFVRVSLLGCSEKTRQAPEKGVGFCQLLSCWVVSGNQTEAFVGVFLGLLCENNKQSNPEGSLGTF